MKTSQIVVTNSVGLHARPAALFVQLANKFVADISLSNLVDSDHSCNAKSILGVLTCAVKQGDQIEIKAEGIDEEAAVQALVELVRRNFAEEEEHKEELKQ